MKQSALFLVTALTTLFAPAATAQTMFVVDYVQSRTLGDRGHRLGGGGRTRSILTATAGPIGW